MADSTMPRVDEPLSAAPRVRSNLTISPAEFAGRACYLVEDPLSGRFFRVGVREFELLRRLDGKTTLAQAISNMAATLGSDALTAQEALAVCRWLADNELLAGNAESRPPKQRPLWQRFNPLAVKLPLVNPDRLLAVLLPWFAWLFSRGFLILWTCLGSYAVYLAWLHAGELAAAARTVLDPDNWWRMLAAWLALKLVHESAHGLACKHFGGHVARGGVMFILLAPVAYVDVTSSWRFRSKWQRIITAAAGMYAELFVAALAMMAWTQLPDGTARRLAFDIALMASIGTLAVNANPLMRFDGYFILSDLVGIPNLYSCGQQYLFDLLQRLLGLRPPRPDWPPRMRRIIAVYAIASLAWRWFVYAAIALPLVGLFSYGGGVLAAAIVLWTAGPSAWQWCRRLRQAAAGQRQVMPRLVVVVAAASVMALAVAGLALRPAWTSAPAVVEYAPLVVIRATSPGFVERVLVRSGERVAAGQELLVLNNEELRLELADVALALAQSRQKARMYQQAGEQARYQAELAQVAAWEKKHVEALRRVEQLVIRAPADGCLMSRSLGFLQGQYLAAGDEIAVLGNESSKELLIAVAQEDLNFFNDRLGSSVTVQVSDPLRRRFETSLERLEPRATENPPHDALLATAGGPLAAMPRDNDERQDGRAPQHKLVVPRFTARAPLSAEESLRLHCGQVLWTGFYCSGQTVAGRAWQAMKQWLDSQLARYSRGGFDENP